MDTKKARERSYEDWGAVMADLLQNEPEKRDMAFRKLNRLLSRFLGQLRVWDHSEDWQDLRQTVILKLVKSFREGNMRESKAFVSYARTITRNEFYDFLRARRGEDLVEMPDLGTEVHTDEETMMSIRRALESLPENHQRAVKAVYLEDQTYEEAAASTGIPLGSLKRYLRLGLAQLHDQLAGAFSGGVIRSADIFRLLW